MIENFNAESILFRLSFKRVNNTPAIKSQDIMQDDILLLPSGNQLLVMDIFNYDGQLLINCYNYSTRDLTSIVSRPNDLLPVCKEYVGNHSKAFSRDIERELDELESPMFSDESLEFEDVRIAELKRRIDENIFNNISKVFSFKECMDSLEAQQSQFDKLCEESDNLNK